MRDIPGYNGYMITRDGVIYSKKRRIVMSPSVIGGYLAVHIPSNDGKRTTARIHRLVAMTYVPNPNNLPVVDHIDGDTRNNHDWNLRWCTPLQNANFELARKHLHESHTRSSYINAQREAKRHIFRRVRRIDDGVVFESISSAARAVNATPSDVNNAIKHRNGTTHCRGYHFEFA